MFVSVQQAAKMLDISPWSMYELLNAGSVESRYIGRRRKVVLTSLHDYATALPTTAPSETA